MSAAIFGGGGGGASPTVSIGGKRPRGEPSQPVVASPRDRFRLATPAVTLRGGAMPGAIRSLPSRDGAAALGGLQSRLPPGMGGSAVRLVHSSSGHGAPFAA
jgi:hypothetical protein